MPCPSQTSFARCFPLCVRSLYQKAAKTLEKSFEVTAIFFLATVHVGLKRGFNL